MTRGLLAVLYGSQFMPLAFCLSALTAILRERGGALEHRCSYCQEFSQLAAASLTAA